MANHGFDVALPHRYSEGIRTDTYLEDERHFHEHIRESEEDLKDRLGFTGKWHLLFDTFITLKIIAVITIWFIIQFEVAPAMGIGVGSDQWYNLFTLTESNIFSIGLITSMLSHGNVPHLLINMFVLFSFGRVAELYLSKKRYLLLLIVGGLIASLSQMFVITQFVSGNFPPIVGASGAIAAVIGFVIMKRPNEKLYLFFIIPMKMWLGAIIFIGGSIAVIVLYGFGAGNFAHTAHIAGMVFGLIIGALTSDNTKTIDVDLSKYVS